MRGAIGTRVLVSVLVLALVATGALGATAPTQTHGGPNADADAATDLASPEVRFAYTLALAPDHRGQVRVTLEATIPETVSRLQVEPAPNATVTDRDGFEPNDGAFSFKWDGTTAGPTLTYLAPANVTSETFGGFDFVSTGTWALVNLERIDGSTQWWYTDEDPTFREQFDVDGPGYAGSGIAYLRSTDVVDRPGTNQTIRLIVPTENPPDSGAAAVGSTLGTASAQLRVGARDRRVNVFVATDPVRRGGVATSGEREGVDDIRVHAGAAVADPSNVWAHEYVHTRQDARLTDRMAWFTEASAEYYAAVVTYRQGRVGFETLHDFLTTEEHRSAVLAEPDAWADPLVPYTKGRRVVAALDARIRTESNGTHTLQTVFRRMNDEEEVTYVEFKDFVAAAAGTRLDGWLDTYIGTTAVPSVPANRSRFGPPPELDRDGDGLGTPIERNLGTDPATADSDGDGLRDGREFYRLGLDPTAADTDGDGLKDGRELELGTDPTDTDTDFDGLADGAEVAEHGTEPTNADTDGDDLPDGAELTEYGTDPTAADTDGDGLKDGRELELGTDPTVKDTDGDGVSDGEEVEAGTDPLATPTPTPTATATDPDATTGTDTTTAAGTDGDATTTAAGGSAPTPGFGAGVAAVALVAFLYLARRR